MGHGSVKRIDYARPTAAAAQAARLNDPHLRRILRAAGCAVVAIAAVAAIESVRYVAAARDDDAAVAELATREGDARNVQEIAREVDRLTALAAHVDALRASAPRGAAEIAAIGDRLPPDVWLSAVRIRPDAIELEGHTTRLAAIPDALTSLAGARGRSRAHLTMLQANRARGGVDYALVLRAP
jgi:Tfp pilus assembly protein PilN